MAQQLNKIIDLDQNFTLEIEGKKTQLFVLKNKNGLEAAITNHGLRIVSLNVPDRNNVFEDIVLGFSSLDPYLTDNGKYFGCIVGQYCNRIENGKFSLEGIDYQLEINNDSNHLHGGPIGYSDVVWDADQISPNKITFEKTFEHLKYGYPGNTTIKVSYILNDENEFKMYYEASTDQTTIINLTHHSFFNLKGEGNGDIEDHIITINADQYVPVNKNLVPKNGFKSVENTLFDFRSPKILKDNINVHDDQLEITNGYDQSFAINKAPRNKEGLALAATVNEPISGRSMEVYTNEPGVHFYTGNFIDGSMTGKSGKKYPKRGGLCLETQHFPNSPNIPEFPSTTLKPGETYTSVCVYKFFN